MDLHQLEYVVAVVDHGGFTAASSVLFVSQPSLSQGVRTLERELGIELFFRLGRSVVPTPAGEVVIDQARQLLRDLATLRSTAAAAAGGLVGRLDLAAIPTLAVDPVAPLIGRFRRLHPDVTIRLLEPEHGREVADLVRSGAAELGITDVTATQQGLRAEVLFRQEYLAVCPPGTTGDPDGTLRIAELARMALITTPRGTSSRTLLDDALARGGHEPAIAVEVAHREAIVPLVLAGAGTSLVPAPLAAIAADEGAVVLALHPAVRRRVGLVHRNGALSPAAAAFAELARTHAASDGEPG